MKILRAWDSGRNQIRCIVRNPETGRTNLQDVKTEWFFYVHNHHMDENKTYFNMLKEHDKVNRYEREHIYTRVYVDREHASELLDRDNSFVWEYRDVRLNSLLKALTEKGIPHCEADLSVAQRWITTNDIEFDSDLKVVFLDIETDDEKISGQPVPGEFQILSIAFVDGQTGTKAWLCAKDRTLEAEKVLLEKVAKILNGYDVLAAWNGSAFDFPYLKVRMMIHGISIDWRKKFLQDHMKIFQNLGPKVQSYSLDAVSKFVLQRGKVVHKEKIFQMFLNNRSLLKEYNCEDTQLMYDMEQKTKFLACARQINCVGLCPCDDVYVSRKIDMLLLKQASIDGNYHFKTKVRKSEEEEEEAKKFEGAFVFDPIPGLYSDVKVLDFSSLYPNVIISFNLSPDTIIELDNKDYGTNVIHSVNGHSFRKDIIGMLPKLVLTIVSERKKYKKMMEAVTPGTVEHKTYDALQYAWKALGLSFYGCVGNQHTRFYDRRIAEAVTLGGQFLIKSVDNYFQSQSIKTIYGDTDSLFIILKNDKILPTLISNISKICEHIVIKKHNCSKSTLEMAYDKGFSKLVILTKKRYAGYLTYLDGHYLKEPKLYVAGLEFKRTDGCNLLKTKQEELLKQLLSEKSLIAKEAVLFIEKLRDYLFSKEIKLNDIIIGQKLTKNVADYKSLTMHLKVVEEMEEDDEEVYVGDKIMYFIESMDIEGKPVPRPESKFEGVFDRIYYWNKKIYPALKRILDVVFTKINWKSYLIQSSKLRQGKALIGTKIW